MTFLSFKPGARACLLGALLLSGCGVGGGGGTAPAQGPPAATEPVRDLIRTGDKITVRLNGVPDGGYLIELEVPASGQISVPLLKNSFQATGRATAELAEEITDAYRSGRIYTTPRVAVLQQERFVNLGGDVRSPSRVVYTPDLTLLSAINSCGGFTEFANRRTVRIIRGAQVFQVDAVAASRTPGADIPLLPGDQVYVPRTAF